MSALTEDQLERRRRELEEAIYLGSLEYQQHRSELFRVQARLRALRDRQDSELQAFLHAREPSLETRVELGPIV